jgi:hypothetical protein
MADPRPYKLGEAIGVQARRRTVDMDARYGYVGTDALFGPDADVNRARQSRLNLRRPTE